MLAQLLDLVFPKRCVSCGSFGSFFCQSCQKRIEFFEDQVCPHCELPSLFGLTHPRCQKNLGIDGMFVLGHYRGPLERLIKAVKYQRVWKSLEVVADQIVRRYNNKFVFDFLVPVPLSPKRESERGFNQAAVLATEIAKKFPRQVAVANIIKRVRHTKPQFDLKMRERRQNVAGAFSLKELVVVNKIPGQNFCLIDDVATTGSTLFECAKVLKRSGAGKVFAITIARGGGEMR